MLPPSFDRKPPSQADTLLLFEKRPGFEFPFRVWVWSCPNVVENAFLIIPPRSGLPQVVFLVQNRSPTVAPVI